MTTEIEALTQRIIAEPRNASLYHERGWLHAKSKQWEFAMTDFDQAVTLAPDEVDFRLSRGRLRGHLGGNLGIAERDFAHAIAFDPSNARASILLGRMHHNWHQSEAAIASYDRAIELEPENAVIRSDRGETFAYMGQLDRALEDFSAAIRLDPANSSYYQKRAIARLYDNPEVQPEDSLPDLEEAIRLDSSKQWYRLERGYIRFCLGQWEGAASDFACQDIPDMYSMVKHQGAKLAAWYYLARTFADHQEIGRKFVADELHWYLVEMAADPKAKPEQFMRRWPVPVSRLLLGEISERQVHESLARQLAEVDGSYIEESVEEALLEFRFVLGELALARGDQQQALTHLEPVLGLPARNPMRWVATRQVASLRDKLRVEKS